LQSTKNIVAVYS